MSEGAFPPAPVLNGEILLDVYTHPSVRPEGGSDNERYVTLGEQVFQAAVTHAIFLRFPQYRRNEIVDGCKGVLTDENYEQWSNYYHFRDKLRYNPSVSTEVRSSKGAREIFHAYVGGLYMQANGPAIVNSWVYNLITPPEARVKEEQPIYSQPPPPSMPYQMPPPPPPGFPRTTRSRANSFSSGRQVPMGYEDPSYGPGPPTRIVFLPRFNEICTQRRYNVQYPAEQGGLQHSPRWIVNCIVDGVPRGQGSATTKQLAKEEAAKQAWLSFGWNLP